MSKELKKVAHPKQKYLSTQDWLDIQEIRNGIITLKSGQLAAVIEVQPINFNFMSRPEQDHVLALYQGFLDSLPCPVQMFSMAMPINLDRYYETLRRDFDRCRNYDLQVMIKAQEEFVRDLVEDLNILKRRHFVAVWAPPVQDDEGLGRYLPFKRKQGRGSDRRLWEYVQQVQGALNGMGIQNELLNDTKLTALITGILNPVI